MANMNRVRVVWNGLNGLPGLSTFYYPEANTDVSALVTFFQAIKDAFPSGLTWTIPSDGDVIDPSSGKLVGGWNGTGGGQVASTSGSLPYAAGVGARIRWNTGGILNGRRLKGSTFLTHIASSVYDTSGTIDNARVTGWTTAANTLAGSGLLVWHRPKPGTGATGGFASVTSASVPDQVSWLRTRRG